MKPYKKNALYKKKKKQDNNLSGERGTTPPSPPPMSPSLALALPVVALNTDHPTEPPNPLTKGKKGQSSSHYEGHHHGTHLRPSPPLSPQSACIVAALGSEKAKLGMR